MACSTRFAQLPICPFATPAGASSHRVGVFKPEESVVSPALKMFSMSAIDASPQGDSDSSRPRLHRSASVKSTQERIQHASVALMKRYSSATWDLDSVLAKKQDILEGNLLKFRVKVK